MLSKGLQSIHTPQVHNQSLDRGKAAGDAHGAYSSFCLLRQHIDIPSRRMLDLLPIVLGILSRPSGFGSEDSDIGFWNAKVGTGGFKFIQRGQYFINGVLRDWTLDSGRILCVKEGDALAILINRGQRPCR